MIVVKLWGGLGNQMFQYAVAYAQKQKVFIDLRYLLKNNKTTETFTKRDFELTLFPNLKYERYGLLQKIIFRIRCEWQAFPGKKSKSPFVVEQTGSEYVAIPQKSDMYLNGFFQSERYFVQMREEILNVFQFPELDPINQQIAGQIQSSSHSVALHIRRGDYLKPEALEIHGVLPLEYYSEALQIIYRKTPSSGRRIILFSDDPEFARQNFQHLENAIFVEGNENAGWKDMALMSLCRHHIIANSSFSWWGAWLSKQPDPINIASKNWFNPNTTNFDIQVFIPENWLTL